MIEEKSEKRMIIRKELINEIILKMLKGYKSLEYESRRLKLKQVRTKRRPISFGQVHFRDTTGGGETNIEVDIACLFMCSKCRLLF